MQRASRRDKETGCNCFENATSAKSLSFSKMSCQAAILFVSFKRDTPGIMNSSFFSSALSIIHSAVTTTRWKDTNCPFLRRFLFTRPLWLVKPTISSFKLYHHSHVLIKKKKKKSFLSENVKSGIRSVSKNVPRIMEKLAKTNTRGKSCHRLLNQVTALCSVLSHPRSPTRSRFLRPSSLSPSLSAIKYFIITQWASECKWCNWQLRVKAWSQSWLCKYLSMTDLLAGRGGERQGAGDSQWSVAHWSTPGAIQRSAATRGSFLPGYRWPHSLGGPRRSWEGYKAGWGGEVGIRGAIITPNSLLSTAEICHKCGITCHKWHRCKMT